MNETEKRYLSRLFRDTELLPRVLQLLEAGVDLHDDTYEAQFLDALERVIRAEEESFKHDLLRHCTYNLESRSLVNVKFRLNLATVVIKCVPEYSIKIMGNIALPIVSDSEDTWIYYLQFYQQVFRNLEPDKYKSLYEEFWSKFLLPACKVRKDGLSKYVCQDIQNTFVTYVEYLMFILECQDSEIENVRRKLEDNFKQLHLDIGPKILEYLKPLVKKMMTDKQILQSNNGISERSPKGFKFILDWVNRNLRSERTDQTSKWMYEPKHISPSRLYCDLEIEAMVQNGEDDFSSSHSFESVKPAVKKRICTAWVKSRNISPLTVYILIRDCLEKDIWLIQHALALLTDESDLASLCSPLGYHEELKDTLIAIVHKIFQLYQEESECVTDKTIRVVIQFGKKFFGTQVAVLPNANLMLLLDIASQKYSGDDFIKGDLLLMLSLILRNGPPHPDCMEFISRLATLSRDPSLSLNVRDSALRCLESYLEGLSRCLLSDEHEQLSNEEITDRIMMAVKQILNGNERSLKAPVIAISRHLIGHQKVVPDVHLQLLSQIFPDRDVDSLTYCDLYHDDARLEMMRLAARHWGTLHSSPEVINIAVEDIQFRIVNFVIGSLRHDSFWEVKRESASFFDAVFEVSKRRKTTESRILFLEKHNFFTGVSLGLKDYESPVQERFFNFLKQTRNDFTEFLNVDLVINEKENKKEIKAEGKGVKRKHHTEIEFNEEEAEDILDVNDKVLVNMLNKRQRTQIDPGTFVNGKSLRPSVSFPEFRDLCASLTDPVKADDPVTDLNSIMEDILASFSGEGQIDLVDCY